MKFNILFKALALVLILTTIIIPVNSFEFVETEESIQNFNYTRRLRSIFDAKIHEIKQSNNLDVFEIATIKEAYDFAGNAYILVECYPSGYLIFSEDAGRFVEFSHSSGSPYLGHSENIYYCGPMFYYYTNESGNIQHLYKSNEVINSNMKDSFAESCNEYHNKITAESNAMVLSYLNGEYPNKTFLSVATEAMENRASLLDVTENRVPWSEFFDTLDECGYYEPPNSSGICGYISLAMVIAYKEYCTPSSNYMDEYYWTDSSRIWLKGGTESLAWHLRCTYGTTDAVRSTEIKETSQGYFANRGVGVSHVSLWSPFFTDGTIRNSIDDWNPVIVVGDIEETSGSTSYSHTAVIYAYSHNSGLFGDTTFKAHMGWDGGSEVWIVGSFGSMYVLEG